MKVGAICCALMPIFREREIAFAVRRAKARVLVVADEFRGRKHADEVAAMLAGAGAATKGTGGNGAATNGDGAEHGPLPVEHVLVVGADGAPVLPKTPGARWHDFAAALDGAEPDRAAIEARKPAPTALSQLFFTSGSTGEPKGVLHRYDALTRAAMMEVEHLGLGPRRHDLHPHPARPPDRPALRDVAGVRARLDPGDPGRLGRPRRRPGAEGVGTAPSCRRRRRSSPTSSA